MRKSEIRKNDKKEEVEEGAPSWMVSYGDLMSLLLTFFVLIATFSSIQQLKFQKAMGSLKGSLGVMKYLTSPREPSSLKSPRMRGYEKTEPVLQEIQNQIEKTGIDKAVHIEERIDGILIRMTESVLFESGKAELKRSSFEFMAKIGKVVKDWPNRTRIEGHTDNVPIHNTQFPSNWELSAIRAISVVKFFQKVSLVDAQKMYYTGFGEFRPLVPNTSPKNRAKNRRVEILLEYDENQVVPLKTLN